MTTLTTLTTSSMSTLQQNGSRQKAIVAIVALFSKFRFFQFFFSYLRSKFFLAFGFSIFQNDLFHPPPLPQPRAARPHPPPLQVQLPNGVLRTSINLSGRAKRQKSCNYTLKDVGVIFFFKVASFKGKQIEVRRMHLVELLVGQVVTR